MKRKVAMEDERPEYNAREIHLLDCVPGNFDTGDGEQVVIFTLAHGGHIEVMVFPLGDTRNMVTRMLAALATYDDAFAQRLLEQNFDSDADGKFVWPR